MDRFYTEQEVMTLDLPCGCEITVLSTDKSYRSLCWNQDCVEAEVKLRKRCARQAA